MNKKIISCSLAFALLLSCYAHAAQKKDEKVVLKSRFLEIVDGPFINGEIIGITLKVRKQMLEMLHGRHLKGDALEGLYEFEGQQCSIKVLAEIESRLVRAQEELQADLNDASDANQKEEIQSKLDVISATLAKLAKLLECVKQVFQNVVGVFMDSARSAKEPVIMLINEYCEKAKCPESLLLDWSRIEGDAETESFNQQVTNFSLFYSFGTDLSNFLEALVRGCPKAQKQFRKLVIERRK